VSVERASPVHKRHTRAERQNPNPTSAIGGRQCEDVTPDANDVLAAALAKPIRSPGSVVDGASQFIQWTSSMIEVSGDVASQ